MLDFYKKEIFSVLDRMTSDLNEIFMNVNENFAVCFGILSPDTKIDEQFKSNVKNLAMKFSKQLPDASEFISEFEVSINFFDQLRKVNPKMTTSIKSAAHICYDQFKKKNLFANVIKVYRHFLSPPPSVCSSERSFIRLKLLKSYLGNKMSQNRLHHLMLISSEKDIASLIDLNKLTKLWVEMKTRRIQF